MTTEPKSAEERKLEALEQIAANLAWIARSLSESNERQKAEGRARAKLG